MCVCVWGVCDGVGCVGVWGCGGVCGVCDLRAALKNPETRCFSHRGLARRGTHLYEHDFVPAPWFPFSTAWL